MSVGRQFIKFGLVGGLNTAIHYVVFLLLLRLGTPLLLASALGYTVGLLNSFLLNRSWTFRVSGGQRRRQFVCFVVVNLVALGLNLLALELLVSEMHLAPELAQVLAIGASLVVNFIGNRWWVFRGSTPAPLPGDPNTSLNPWRTSMSELNRPGARLALVILLMSLGVSLGLKLAVVHAGAPYVTIDDATQYEGGFLVWFGQAPPQRMYVESWLSGLSSLATYVVGLASDGKLDSLGLNVVADAYASFHESPDRFVAVYRHVALAMDLLTALLVFLLARIILVSLPGFRVLAALVATLYLFSYNTIWCFVVARPDTATALLATVGLILYYYSEFGARRTFLSLSGLALGLATGMKLHAAFFVMFFVLDLWRALGWKLALSRCWYFGLIAVVAFLVSAGSPLFDPLLYAKLRMLNARDDVSPWIHWGDQFIAILRGSGWLVVPLGAVSVWSSMRRGHWRRPSPLVSVAFVVLLWLVLFALIRQLRPYWMLPVLPLFYVLAVDGLSRLPGRWVQLAGAAAILGVMLWQCIGEVRTFRGVAYDELRSWVQANVDPEEPIYILGYEALNLPKNSKCRAAIREGLSRKINSSRLAGDPYTLRHVELWEERARITLLDMLGDEHSGGYCYFGVHAAPLPEWSGIIERSQFEYVLVQQGFDLSEEPEWMEAITRDYSEIATAVGPGGGGVGLSYRILARK